MAFSTLLLVLIGAISAILVLVLIVLVIRRYLQERKALSDKAAALRFRNQAMRALGQKDISPLASIDEWRRNPVALDVASHLLQLVRGDDRAALLRLVSTLELAHFDLQRLRSRRPATRISAIRRLGNFPAPAITEAMTAAMTGDRDLAVRLEAGLALARLDALPAIGIVVAALDPHGPFAAPAHRAIFRTFAVHRVDELIGAYDETAPLAVRLAFIEGIGASADPAGFDLIQRSARDAAPEMRCEALRAMRAIGHPSFASLVIGAMIDLDWTVRLQAAMTAGAMRLANAKGPMRALELDPSWWVRLRAREAMAQLAPPPAAAI